MAENKQLSKGEFGFAVGASVIGGIFEGIGQHYLNRAAFKIQETQARINEMLAERAFQDQMTQLYEAQEARREARTQEARKGMEEKRRNNAAIRVARAERGGTNANESDLIANEAAYSAFKMAQLAAIDREERQAQFQKIALFNDRFANSISQQVYKPYDPGIFGALAGGLGAGINMSLALNPYVNYAGDGDITGEEG